MTDWLPTALDPLEILWRDHLANRLLVQPFDHTAANMWTPSIEGWLYYDREAILFIGDTAFTTPSTRGAARADGDRVIRMTYRELGHAEILEALSRKERRISFTGGMMFLAPKKHVKAIARRCQAALGR